MLKSSTVATDLSTFANDWRTDSQVTKLILNLANKDLNLAFNSAILQPNKNIHVQRLI